MVTSYEDIQGSEQSVHEHPDHNFQDRVQLAGDDTLPIMLSPKLAPRDRPASDILDDIRRPNQQKRIPGENLEIKRK